MNVDVSDLLISVLCFFGSNVHSRSAGRPTISLLKEAGEVNLYA